VRALAARSLGVPSGTRVATVKGATDQLRVDRPFRIISVSTPLPLPRGVRKKRPERHFHGLRHTYASRLAMRGVPLAVITQQLGHADTRMVEKHYGHLAPSYVADTVRARRLASSASSSVRM
jgi:integrase